MDLDYDYDPYDYYANRQPAVCDICGLIAFNKVQYEDGRWVCPHCDEEECKKGTDNAQEEKDQR